MAISFLLLFFLPRRADSRESKCGRTVRGKLGASVDTFREKGPLSFLQRIQINQLCLTLLSPATIDEAINWWSISKMIYYHQGNLKGAK